MFDSSIIQVLVVLGFPYLIRGVRSLFAKAPPPSPLQRQNQRQNLSSGTAKISTWNRCMFLLLGLTALYHLLSPTFNNPPDIFKTLALPADCPNFILRQSWEAHAERDPDFMKKFPDSLRELFKAHESRLIYQIYGQDAFMNCEHCTERSDYLLYLVPGALTSYVSMAVILGLATSQTSHLNKYRTWGSAALVGIALLEYTIINKGSDIGSLQSFVRNDGYLIGVRGGQLIRHGSLAMIAIVIMGLLHRSARGHGPRDEVEILNDLCQAQEAMIQRHRALQLARVASLRDPLLRKQFVEYWKRREVEHGILVSDTEYKEARDLALSRIDVETITQEADQYIESIIRAGERVPDAADAPTATDGENLTKLGQEMAT
ncbi:hypothetical protein BG011_003573 [Mortierella polycephala]|uniref:Uncharacterized protein n=1 Tax=Mortierella polycephala TaxID=41804 RepID=A0A9P6Q418_9FUNG|nr:hypothetical protein BG011_003573 [Mortierella polycephala]